MNVDIMGISKFFYFLLLIAYAECYLKDSVYYYDPKTCGMAPKLIESPNTTLGSSVNDAEFENGEIPWAVEIKVKDGDICGGVLISQIHVMVSGSCIPNTLGDVTDVQNLEVLSKYIIKINGLKRYPVTYSFPNLNSTLGHKMYRNAAIFELNEAVYEVPHVCVDFLESNGTDNYENGLVSFNVFYNNRISPNFFSIYHSDFEQNNLKGKCITSDYPDGEYICVRRGMKNGACTKYKGGALMRLRKHDQRYVLNGISKSMKHCQYEMKGFPHKLLYFTPLMPNTKIYQNYITRTRSGVDVNTWNEFYDIKQDYDGEKCGLSNSNETEWFLQIKEINGYISCDGILISKQHVIAEALCMFDGINFNDLTKKYLETRLIKQANFKFKTNNSFESSFKRRLNKPHELLRDTETFAFYNKINNKRVFFTNQTNKDIQKQLVNLTVIFQMFVKNDVFNHVCLNNNSSNHSKNSQNLHNIWGLSIDFPHIESFLKKRPVTSWTLNEIKPFKNKKLKHYDYTNCGKVKSKGSTKKTFISKGVPVRNIEESPWVVSLSEIGGKGSFCTGTLISRKHVLTAAHCVTAKTNSQDTDLDKIRLLNNVSIIIGSNCVNPFNMTTCAQEFRGLKRRIRRINLSQTYFNNVNDYAIIELDKEVPLEHNHACLPFFHEKVFSESTPFVTWGYGIELSSNTEVQYPKYLKRDFFKNIPTVKSNCSPHLSIQNTDNDFLLETDFNHSVCQGDSGGPIGKVMQNQNESRFAVAGITSRGFSLCGWLHANIHRKLEKASTFFFNISCIAAEVNEFMAQAD